MTVPRGRTLPAAVAQYSQFIVPLIDQGTGPGLIRCAGIDVINKWYASYEILLHTCDGILGVLGLRLRSALYINMSYLEYPESI